MSEFKREERYIVIKRKHLSPLNEARIRETLATCGAPTIGCVVVEADWPNYEHVWDTVEQVAKSEWQSGRAQGGEAVADFDAWWDNKARYHDHRSTKALARAAYKQGFSDGYTHPQPAQQGSVPEDVIAAARGYLLSDGPYDWSSADRELAVKALANRGLLTTPQPAHCQTCNDNGMIGGPSYAQPDEGGEPCPDCSEAGVRDRLRDALAETLGDAMDCTRAWSAWGIGTMGPEDFQVIAEDDERLEEIVDAALIAVKSPTEGAE